MAAPRDPDAMKLFVGQIPKTASETDLAPTFEQFGPIAEFSILRDKAGISKGCAFLTFVTRMAAVQCVENLHDKYTCPGMSHTIQVKPADSESKMEERKLFVGMIPKTYSEDQLRAMFLPFGGVEEVAFINKNGVFQGCAFIKMDSRVNAQRAVDTLNQSTTLEGCRAPLVVKYADSDREKQQKRAAQAFQFMNPMMMMYQQMAAQNMGGNMGAGMAGGMGGMGAPRPAMGGAPGMGPGMGGFDMSQAYSASGYGQQPYQQAAVQSAMRPRYGGASEAAGGPEGSNLFIYHIPPELNDGALASLFMPFGNVVSAKVFIDKVTGLSKGFGFVSYDNPVSAQAAISSMNGFQMGPKRLKVELKKSRGAPY